MDPFFGLASDLRRLRLLDLVLPRRCVACGLGEELVCADCRTRLRRLDGTLCARCGSPTAWPVRRCRECAGRRLSFASARAAVAYDGPARPLVAGWKDRGLRPLAYEFAAVVTEIVPCPPVEALAFVPGDPERSLKRGQNAAETLARELGARWALPVETLLNRREPARPQRGLSREERRKNVRNSFTAAARPPTRVALVDDVYTHRRHGRGGRNRAPARRRPLRPRRHVRANCAPVISGRR